MAKRRFEPLWHPRYWPTWLAVGLMRILAWLPYAAIVRFGPWLGRAYARLQPRRREIARINIELCFPDKSPAWREQLLRRHFDSLGTTLLEIPFAWWASDRRVRNLVHLQGLEHLQQALTQGKGVLLLSAHFNSPELSGRLLVREQPFVAMYRPSNDPVMEKLISSARSQWLDAIRRDDARGLIRTLRQGKAVWYAVDQNTARRESVFVDFFGILASTNSATARLAKMTGAAVVPFHAVRRSDGSGYDLFLEPAWEDYPSGDLAADTQRVNDLVEKWVRQTPEQYLWIHRRFRTRPQRSDPPLYAVD